MRVIVAGQMPPPIGGQNLNIKRVFELLSGETDVQAEHWKFEFTRTLVGGRKPGLGKAVELLRVVVRLVKLRCGGPIDFVLYPSGGPHVVPIVRDVCLLPFAKLLCKRVVIHFRAAGIAERFERLPRWFTSACRIVYSRCGDAAIVLTPYGRADPQSLGIREVEVVPNAVEDRRHGRVRTRGDEGAEVRILQVGHLCEDKGTPQTLRAFAEICKEDENVVLQIVGEPLPPYSMTELHREIKGLGLEGCVEVLGVLEGEELDRVYANADMFLFSSVAPYESFGMVLIEAMMWELPIVSTDWRGNGQVVGGDGCGVLVHWDGDLSVNLANGIRRFLERGTEWGDIGQRNRKRYEKEFGLETLRKNLRRVILGLPSDGRRHVNREKQFK